MSYSKPYILIKPTISTLNRQVCSHSLYAWIILLARLFHRGSFEIAIEKIVSKKPGDTLQVMNIHTSSIHTSRLAIENHLRCPSKLVISIPAGTRACGHVVPIPPDTPAFIDTSEYTGLRRLHYTDGTRMAVDNTSRRAIGKEKDKVQVVCPNDFVFVMRDDTECQVRSEKKGRAVTGVIQEIRLY